MLCWVHVFVRVVCCFLVLSGYGSEQKENKDCGSNCGVWAALSLQQSVCALMPCDGSQPNLHVGLCRDTRKV